MTTYVSTRGEAPVASFREALLGALAPDGGLFVPEVWPRLAADTISAFREDRFDSIVAETLTPFASPWLGAAEARQIANAAFQGFASPDAPVPLVEIGKDLYLLELFHGPTLAFKDVAMQVLARLFSRALAETGERIVIVGATSGDTGGAAAAAFAGAPGVDLFILYPHGRISDVQRRFMTTLPDGNVHALAVDGVFDDCQAIVKALFADRAFAESRRLSGVNSINWARLAIQTSYYFSAAAALRARGEARLPVFSVPTGNFGDAFAGVAARRMGLAADRIVIAVNENDILHRALSTGAYRPNAARQTDAPSMDIEVASNFERLLFEASGRYADLVRRLMEDLRSQGGYVLPPPLLDAARQEVGSARVDQAARADAMARWSRAGVLLDPHSAVAVVAAERSIAEGAVGPHIALATAHPAKFPEAVLAATGRRAEVAPALAARLASTERFVRVAASPGAAKDVISALLS